MKRVLSIAAASIVALSLITLFGVLAAQGGIDVLSPAGEVATHQKRLLLFTVGLSALVVVPVFGLLIYISVKYRAGNANNAKYDPDWNENSTLEGLWWGIPIVIIAVLAVITFQSSHSLDPSKALVSSKEPLVIQVVALQWKWLFLYPKDNIATLNYIAIPIDRPVKFSLTANAPMSAFWIPSLGSQTYAMNGMSSTLYLNATKVGTYTGYSTNINGEGYAKMTFDAKAMSEASYESWRSSTMRSPNTMSMREYAVLSDAKSETDQRSYRLQDTTMFDAIVGENGHGAMSHGGAL